MPRYDYECNKCNKTFEIEHPISGPYPDKCNCDKDGVLTRVIITKPVISFVGSGFYVNDKDK